eukprot:3264890-Amphidinium_carterae.1
MQSLLDAYTLRGMDWGEFVAAPFKHEPSLAYTQCLQSLKGKGLERAEAIKDLGLASWLGYSCSYIECLVCKG